jgi:uncharacterized membrane protein
MFCQVHKICSTREVPIKKKKKMNLSTSLCFLCVVGCWCCVVLLVVGVIVLLVVGVVMLLVVGVVVLLVVEKKKKKYHPTKVP